MTIDPTNPFFVYSQRAPRSIDWLYPGLIPIGKVTLLIGDPGIGKSLLAVDLAARVTRGDPLPPARKKQDPARVLFIAGDGETEDVLPERLTSFGADLTKVAGIEETAAATEWRDAGAEDHRSTEAEGKADVEDPQPDIAHTQSKIQNPKSPPSRTPCVSSP